MKLKPIFVCQNIDYDSQGFHVDSVWDNGEKLIIEDSIYNNQKDAEALRDYLIKEGAISKMVEVKKQTKSI